MKKNRKIVRKKKKNNSIIFLVIVLIVYFSYNFINQIITYKNLNSEKLNYEAQIEELDAEIKDLQEDYEKRDSLDFAEKIARDKLGMIKSKEIVVIDKSKDDNDKNDN